MRTDDNNNPTAFTTDLARQAGLIAGTDYVDGTKFPTGTLITARIIGDPIDVTIKLINAVGYYNKKGEQRWVYIAMPKFVWLVLSYELKRDIIGYHYQHEGGSTMKGLFPNYGSK